MGSQRWSARCVGLAAAACLACSASSSSSGSDRGEEEETDGRDPVSPGDDDDDDDHAGETGAGGNDDDSGGGDTGEPETPFEPPPPNLRRLQSRQYINSVAVLLGSEAASVATPPDDPEFGKLGAVAASESTLTDADVSAYEASAEAIADVVIADEERIAELRQCEPVEESCHVAFVENFGRLVFRRPLTAAEVERWVDHAVDMEEVADDFDAGTRSVISGMLQSPYFLYRIELGQPDPDREGVYVLDDYEMATRLSFFLVDSTPDPSLLDDAADGLLDDAEEIREAARGLLSRTAARGALTAFHDDYLGLDRVPLVPKDIEEFPNYTPELAQAMADETRRLISDIVWARDTDYLEIYDAHYTFANASLAALYGLADAEELGDSLQRVDLPGNQRAGILGHAGLMSLYAHADQTSPTIRGRFVREALMCGTVPDPPPGADTELPPEDAVTKREQLEQHVADPACAGCHNLTDPIGFALEPLDAIGVYRDEEAGHPIDAAVETPDLGPFDGVVELGEALRGHPDVARCLVRTVLRHATGTDIAPDEAVTVQQLLGAFEASGNNMQDLLVEVAASPAFRYVGEPQ